MSAVGELLAGRYELRSRLGRGGMAEVYRAVDRRLGREVAVKVLAGHLLSDPRSVERFQREGRTAAALNHPNVVDVYDAASEGDTHYLVMELVEGPTLADVIAREAPMPEARALDIAGRIAAALQVAHERGLVHHDVKPANVMFDSDGSVKVTDFGIARAASSDITTIQGTPPYVAPEQARGGRADPRSDVYSLGCVLFEMLTGRPPFVGDGASSVIMQHIERTPPRVGDFRDDVSPNVEEVVRRALAKEPAERYQSAEDLRADIERVAAGKPASSMTIVSTRHLDPGTTVALPADADPPGFEPPRDPTRAYTQRADGEPPQRRGPRRPTLQALTVAMLLILLAVLGFAAWSDARVREQPSTDTAEQPQDEEPPVEEDPAEEPPEEEPPPDDGGDDAPGSSIGQAADRIRERLRRERDEATRRAIERLEREISEAISRRAAGGGDGGGEDGGSTERIQDLRERLRDLTDNEEVRGELRNRLRELLDQTQPFGG
jgi:serine/threonine-protein kinase